MVRVFRPHSEGITLLLGGERCSMNRIHPEGVYEAAIPHDPEESPSGGRGRPDYRLEVAWPGAHTEVVDDPYRFGPVAEQDVLAEFCESGLPRIHHFLGARPIVHEGVEGTCFAVWAPHARNVNLMGEFNGWDARVNPMRLRGDTGVWELFVPGVGQGALYMYEVRAAPDPRPRQRRQPQGPRGPVPDRRAAV